MWIVSNDKRDEANFISNIPRIKNYDYYYLNAGQDLNIYFLMNNNEMFVLRNIKFQAADQFYIDPLKFKTEKISSDKLALPLKIYSDLTREILFPFYNEPVESNTTIIEKNDVKRTQPYVHGIITDESLQPIFDASVLVEINGKYKYGARTNGQGEFEILDLPAGSYMLRIYASEYQMVQYNTRLFSNGKDYTLNVSLRNVETAKPVYESLNQDFRFMAFGNKPQ